MTNKSGVSPLGRAVLVEYYEPERKESLIVIPDHVRKSEVIAEQRAAVVEVGPNAWPNEPPRAKAGDRVLITKYAGFALQGPADGKMYRIINDADIFARITDDREVSK